MIHTEPETKGVSVVYHFSRGPENPSTSLLKTATRHTCNENRQKLKKPQIKGH